MTSRGHFDEAVEDDEEFCEIGGNSSTIDIFLTLATYEESVVDKFKSNLLLPIFWLHIINYNS